MHNIIIVMQLTIGLMPLRFYSSSQTTWRRWLALGCLILPLGCTPYVHERLIDSGAIDASIYHSGHFKHRLFRDANKTSTADKPLHIYIGGDGNPWRSPHQVAHDPTSKSSILLNTMLQDDAFSVYVGRPCYYRVKDKRCRGIWWTHHRYHPEVVTSLVKTVENLTSPGRELWLIGHSGGGSLAVLMGRRLNRPVSVVTIGANLDHRAWTMHHQYSPLTGSLNPMEDTTRNRQMRELHWYATDDNNVLPRWSKAYCRQHKARCQPVIGDHNSGWPSQWPQLLERSKNHFTSSNH